VKRKKNGRLSCGREKVPNRGKIRKKTRGKTNTRVIMRHIGQPVGKHLFSDTPGGTSEK
jgi:hypothetical protein